MLSRRSIQGFIASLFFMASTAYSALDIAEDPLFLSTGAAANVLLNMSVETPMGGGAYNDAPGSIPGCTGRKNVGGVGNNLGTCYFPNFEYVGYFDANKCYNYTSNYFTPVEAANSDHSCKGKSARWSGNFLNWAGMTAIDTYILTMTGGRRVVDTSNKTVVERSLAFVAGFAFHTKAIGSSVTNSNSGVALDTVTPFNDSWARIVQNQNSSSFRLERSGGTNTYTVGVEVCNSSIGLESNCMPRTDGNADYFKPEGLLQRNANSMRFGVMAYTNDNSHTRQGGVLRSNMKQVGPLLGTGAVNPNREYDEDGILNFNPDGVAGANSGVINYVNEFATSAGRYKSFDPVSELFYEASRFFRGMTPTPDTYSGLGTANNGGFPIVTNWQNPLQFECQQNFMVAINDAFPWNDKRLPGTHFPGGTTTDALGRNIRVNRDNAPQLTDPDFSVTTITDEVGRLEQAESGTLLGKLGTTELGKILAPANGANLTPTNGDGRGNSYYLAGIAHYLNTEDISSLPGEQHVTTFMIDSQEFNNNPTIGNVNPLWLAGKYGGFDDANGDKIPQASEWDADGDGEPDNYVLATEPTRMVQQLQESFDSISQVTSAAGTGVAVNSTRLSNDSRIYQATFATTDWSGQLRALALDADGNVGAELWNVNNEFPTHANRNIFTTIETTDLSGAVTATPVEFTDANVALAVSGSVGGGVTTISQITAGTASQSSTAFTGAGLRGTAAAGFDGNTSGVYNDNSVTHTAGTSANDWWEVDLQSQQDLSTVEIYNRGDDCGGGLTCATRLSNVFFMVSNNPFPNDTNLASAISNADYVQQITGAPIRINAGSSVDFTDTQGRTWEGDTSYIDSGNNQSNNDAIANTNTGPFLGDTSDEAIYKTERRRNNEVRFDIPVSDQIDHTVILHFSDSRNNGGNIVVDVEFDGDIVANDYDTAANGEDTASTLVLRYTKRESQLDLNILEESGGNPRINAIEVIPDLTSSVITQNVGIPGQYIRVQKAGGNLNNTNFLSLAEVQPFGTITTTVGGAASIVNYIRGDKSLEVSSGNGGMFRDREFLLGDIINSTPVSSSIENFSYGVLPGSEGSSYANFLADKVARFQVGTNFFNMIYVGANDGMLHAFADTTDVSPSPLTPGQEAFAYIPSQVHDRLEQLTDANYNHQLYVDGTPRVSDAYVNGSWETILVGALGGGGRGLYALNVTDPLNFSATDVMWEFGPDSDLADPANSSAEMGVILSKPLIARLQNGKFVVIFGNGYNSASQKAQLVILDAEDGSVIRVIDTFAGSLSNANGLAEPFLIDLDRDRVVDYAYAGDLLGNMWKFDLTDSNPANWGVALSGQPLFTAKDANGNVQQITSKPAVATNDSGGINVLFGTGKYFEIGDNIIPSNPAVDSFYSIQDIGAAVGMNRSALVQQEILAELDVLDANNNVVNEARVTSDATVDYSQSNGWYIDLITPADPASGSSAAAEGERVIVRPEVRFGRVIFATFTPSANPCSAGGDGWIMVLDATSGARNQNAVIDINGDGNINITDNLNFAGNDVAGSGLSTGGGTGDLLVVNGGDFDSVFIQDNDGGDPDRVDLLGAGDQAGRQSWRQIQ